MRATRLDNGHHALVKDFLERRPRVNLFLLGVLWRYGLQHTDDSLWLGAFDGQGTLRAVVFAPGGAPGGGPAGTAVPDGEAGPCELLGVELGRRGGTHMVVGPRGPADALWTGLGDPPARVRYDQRLYVASGDLGTVGLAVERARAADIPLLADYAGEMMREDLGADPRQVDPSGHYLRVKARVGRGSSWVHRREGTVAFVVDVGTDVPLGAQVGGTYVPPAFRGQGIAREGMRAVAARLLHRVPLVTLHVNEANTAAVRCYEGAGFVRDAAFRLISW